MSDSIRINIGVAAVKAITPIVKRLEKGFQIEQVDELTYQLRLNICGSCEFKRTDNHCAKCLCPIAYKAKLMYSPYAQAVGQKTKVTCPEGHW